MNWTLPQLSPSHLLPVLLLLATIMSQTKSYNRGRIGGSEPTAEYLKKYSYKLTDASIPPRGKKGSTDYTPETYREAVYDGLVFWAGHPYGWTIRENAEMPTICTNTRKRRPSGALLGDFICPRGRDDREMVYCCGEPFSEYCCDHMEAQIFYYRQESSREKLRNAAFIFAIIAGIFLPFVLVVVICLCKMH